ncbi:MULTISPECIES: murein transglycosylase A [unclassified Sphingomonas]|uniref:murein transglycosylase A n=1 Tax=unclassified Sphingomonas TaxID=196159 RepID=UPI0009E6C7CD|nr:MULTISPECIES: murein transglycosylase A [unclassified Sphingomonas]
MQMKGVAGPLIALMLAGCAVVPRDARPAPGVTGSTPAARQPVAATPIKPVAAPTVASGVTTAALAGVVAGPPLTGLPIEAAGAARALAAFVTSCGTLTQRADSSGLSMPADWAPACAAARTTAPGAARDFFGRWFDPVQVGDGKAFATGYYEPEISGSRTRTGPYQTPIYALPKDIVEVDLGLFSNELAERKVRGRVSGNALVPYFDRTEIEEGALAGRGLEIAYAEDPIEFFFLQVQGSGRLRLPDGGVMRIGYAGQNGREYTGIGRLMRDRGLIGPDQASMQGLMAWLRANPAEGRAVMRENKSFVFFRELTGPGPLGALGLPVVAQASVAADPRFVPLGAPVFLSMDRVDASGLWIAQDTGGAIKGPNRFDTFWGAGAEARAIAGGMSARGTAFILLPKPAAARLTARGNDRPAP